jgi:hypothetical protein
MRRRTSVVLPGTGRGSAGTGKAIAKHVLRAGVTQSEDEPRGACLQSPIGIEDNVGTWATRKESA